MSFDPLNLTMQQARAITRRHFFKRCQMGLGAMALGNMLAQDGLAAGGSAGSKAAMSPRAPHYAPKAKQVIFIHLAGSPPQHETFDYKPVLEKYHMKEAPESLTKGQRFAFIRGTPKMLGPQAKFKPCGQNGTMISELLPNIGSVADDLCIVKSMYTDQFNHAPAQLYVHTGEARVGHPSIGSWVTYGLGSENQNLPGFVVMISGGTDPAGGKSLWGSGFLPSVYQGVQCRTTGDPILYVSDPKGIDRATRRRSLDALRQLNQHELRTFGDPETLTRIEQYELAYRMQISVPHVMDISGEPQHIKELYGMEGDTPAKAEGRFDPGFTRNCILARRMVESGVRFVQLYDWGWDIHGTGKRNDLIHAMPRKCSNVDQPIAALIKDLKQRGLLDETLVVVSGEFGRTSMNEARNGSKFLGRDHHPHCFSMFMAGGGVKPGHVHGATDDFGYFITEGKVSVHDFQATLLHLTGMDPHQFSYPHQGLNARLIGPTESPEIRHELLA